MTTKSKTNILAMQRIHTSLETYVKWFGNMYTNYEVKLVQFIGKQEKGLSSTSFSDLPSEFKLEFVWGSLNHFMDFAAAVQPIACAEYECPCKRAFSWKHSRKDKNRTNHRFFKFSFFQKHLFGTTTYPESFSSFHSFRQKILKCLKLILKV